MQYHRSILENAALVHNARHPDSRATENAQEVDAEYVTKSQVQDFARKSGINLKFVRTRWNQIRQLALLAPLISTFHDGTTEIWSRTVNDEGQDCVEAWHWSNELGGPLTQLRSEGDVRSRGWRRELLIISPEPLVDRKSQFGLQWFLQEVFIRSGLGFWIVLFSLLMAVFSLAMPLFFQQVVDRVLGVAATTTLISMLILVSMVGLLGYLTRLARDRMLNWTAQRMDVRLGRWSYGHLLSLPLPFFESRPIGVLSKHMQQGDQAREFVTRTVVGGFLDLLTVAVFLPLVFIYSSVLGAVVGGMALLMALFIALLVIPFNRRLEKLYEAEASRQALLVETLHAIPGIKAAAAETEMQKRHDSVVAKSAQAHYRLMNLSEFAQATIQIMEKALTIAVIGVGAWMYLDSKNGSRLSIGTLIAVQMLAHHITGPVMRLVEAVYQFQRVRLAIRMLGEVMHHPQEALLNSRGLRPQLTGEILVDKVSFRYPGSGRTVLNRFTIHIKQGEVVVVTGPSGCGKSTLMKLLRGDLLPATGRILYRTTDGRWMDLRDLDIRWLRSRIGTVLQETAFLSDSVAVNIALAHPATSRDQIDRAARAAGAATFIARLKSNSDLASEKPQEGYDAVLQENGIGLSGGEKQRLGLARALVSDPAMLFLDEPTSALDATSEELIVRTLAELARRSQRTMLIITHRPALLGLPGCREVKL